MKRPSIGVVIATPGRASLMRTINSIQYQGLEHGDDILIVGDGYHQQTADLVALVGAPFRYVATRKTRDWGHSQQNYGLKIVGGDWLILQDDDDVFLPRAFDEIRSIVEKLESPRPIIGRVVTPFLGILWTEPKKEPLDGHCIVVPNDKKKLGYFESKYEGDQTWLATNLSAYDTYTWADRIWSLTRPQMKLWPVKHPYQNEWVFYRDEDGFLGKRIAELSMLRGEEEYWQAHISRAAHVWADEMREIVEFAAWAGQGSDVRVNVDERDRALIDVLVEYGYTPHGKEYIFEWPPHRFVPPERKKDE